MPTATLGPLAWATQLTKGKGEFEFRMSSPQARVLPGLSVWGRVTGEDLTHYHRSMPLWRAASPTLGCFIIPAQIILQRRAPFALCGQLGEWDQGVPGTSSKSHGSAVSNKSPDYCGLTPTLQNLGIPGKMPGKDVSSVCIALGIPWGCMEKLD